MRGERRHHPSRPRARRERRLQTVPQRQNVSINIPLARPFLIAASGRMQILPWTSSDGAKFMFVIFPHEDFRNIRFGDYQSSDGSVEWGFVTTRREELIRAICRWQNVSEPPPPPSVNRTTPSSTGKVSLFAGWDPF